MRSDETRPIRRHGLVAATHPSSYLIHKYWARKPHNVVSALLDEVAAGREALFVDPYCGSGVPLSEAAKLGYACAGADVNPVAVHLTRLSMAPADPGELERTVRAIIADVAAEHLRLYELAAGTFRYAVHAVVSGCASCGAAVAATDARKDGRRYCCPHCGTRVLFNLENLRTTRVVQVTTDKSSGRDPEACRLEEERAARSLLSLPSPFDQAFSENRRILCFHGMTTRQLFTSRNFSFVATLAERFHRIADAPIREAALVLLTSGLAQCSRLIPFRNNLTTGGQAWSVPGYWVPPVHLETNPIAHFGARLKKLLRGLKELRASRGRASTPAVFELEAEAFLGRLHAERRHADVVFLDPPYGDSVPYLEFSALWNSFLGKLPRLDADVSVSDRAAVADSWRRYEQRLASTLLAVERILASSGVVVATFNSNDLRAWHAILAALQGARLGCTSVFYQHPAVISAKSQLAPRTSYVGDFYCVFERTSTPLVRDLACVERDLALLAAYHRQSVPDELLTRAALTSWLRNNVEASLLDDLAGLLDRKFEQPGPDGLRRYLGTPTGAEVTFDAELRRVVAGVLEESSLPFPALYAEIAHRLGSLGVPGPGAVREQLNGFVHVTAGQCRLTVGRDAGRQLAPRSGTP